MKTLTLVLLITGLSALTVQAKEAVQAEEVSAPELARILINNPIKSMKDFPGCNDSLVSAEKQDGGKGVITFTLTLRPSGMCNPVNAVVTIVEDSTPMAYDGARKYTTSFEVTPATRR